MWFKLDDGSTFHSKVVAVGNEAWGAFCRCGTWSAAQLTDGFIPDHIAKTIATPRIFQKLFAENLLEKVDGGWQIHDFNKYNPKSGYVRKKREEAKERMANVRANETRTSQKVSETFALPVPVPSVLTEPRVADARRPLDKAMPLTDEWKAIATKAGIDPRDVSFVFVDFRSFHIENSRFSSDWSMTWDRWCRDPITHSKIAKRKRTPEPDENGYVHPLGLKPGQASI